MLLKALRLALFLVFCAAINSVQAQFILFNAEESEYNVQYEIASNSTVYVLHGSKVSKTTDNGNSWRELMNFGNIALGIHFIAPDTGWVCGGSLSHGYIYRTFDGGATWTKTSTHGIQIYDIHFLDTLSGYYVGNFPSHGSHSVRKTIDGGKSWTISKSGGDYLRSIHAFDTSLAWAIGDNGNIYRTANGGKTWEKGESDVVHFKSGFATSPDSIWAVGSHFYGKCYLSTDSGKTYQRQNLPTLAGLKTIFFSSPDTGFITGDFNTYITTTDAGKTWKHVNSMGPQNHLNVEDLTSSLAYVGDRARFTAVQVIDSNLVYINASTTLFKSVDGGSTWTKDKYTGGQIYAFQHPSSSHGYIAHINWKTGYLNRTSDSGESWTIDTLPHIGFRDLAFINQNNGWAICRGASQNTSEIHMTEDAGVTWQKQLEARDNIMSIQYYSDKIAWACGHNGCIYRTINGGKDWERMITKTSCHFKAIYAVSKRKIFAVGNYSYGECYLSKNGGETWEKVQIPTLAHLTAVKFLNKSEGVIIGDKGVVLRTINGGKSWTKYETNTEAKLNDMHIFEDRSVLVVGDKKTILRIKF